MIDPLTIHPHPFRSLISLSSSLTHLNYPDEDPFGPPRTQAEDEDPFSNFGQPVSQPDFSDEEKHGFESISTNQAPQDQDEFFKEELVEDGYKNQSETQNCLGKSSIGLILKFGNASLN